MIRRFLALNSLLMGESRRFDWKGLLLAGTGTVSLLNGLVSLHADKITGGILAAFGVACLAGFIWYQTLAEEPLINMKLFAHRQFAMGALVAFIYGMGLFGSTYLLPIYM